MRAPLTLSAGAVRGGRRAGFACARGAEREERRESFFVFVFSCLVFDTTPTLTDTPRPLSLLLSLSSPILQAAALDAALMDRWARATADARAAAARFRSGRAEAATFPAAAAARRAPFLETEEDLKAFGLFTFLGRVVVTLTPSGASAMSTVAGLTRPEERRGWRMKRAG